MTTNFLAAVEFIKRQLKKQIVRTDQVSHEMEIKSYKFKSYVTSGNRNDCLIFAVLGAILPQGYMYEEYDAVVNKFRREYLPKNLPDEVLNKSVANVPLRESLISKSYLGDELLDALVNFWGVNFLVFSRRGRSVDYVIPKEAATEAATEQPYYLILNIDGSHYEKMVYCSPDPLFMLPPAIKNYLCKQFYANDQPKKDVVEQKIKKKQAEQVFVTIKPFKHDYTFLHSVFRKTNVWIPDSTTQTAVLVQYRPLSPADYNAYYRTYLATMDDGKNIPTDLEDQDMYMLEEHLQKASTEVLGTTTAVVITDSTAACVDLSSAETEMNIAIALSLFNPYQNNYRYDQKDKLIQFIDQVPNLKLSIVLVKGSESSLNATAVVDDFSYLQGPSDPVAALVWSINNRLPMSIPFGNLTISEEGNLNFQHKTYDVMPLDFSSTFLAVFNKQVQWA